MPDAIIIGAGPAGLACAACLRTSGLQPAVIEARDSVGSAWRRHYDRLHLHTDRDHSGLPGFPMPRAYPKYPSRAQVVDYLESYAAHFAIRPAFDTTVSTIARDGADWLVHAETIMPAPIVVVATGMASTPHQPSWPGLSTFRGPVVHSSAYRNPAPYEGQRVLVVGLGNSGGEIALDLAEAGVATTLSVRGPIQILPRDLLGLPILTWAILYRRLPAALVDRMNAPILRLAIGRVDDLGLKLSPKGARRMIEEDGKVPLFDIGTLGKIRDGSIAVRGGIEEIAPGGVRFTGASAPEAFDAIVLATGFRPNLTALLPGIDGVLDAGGAPLQTGRETSVPGLYFCGQIASPTGQLREIGIEAQRIAGLAKAYLSRLARAA